MPFVIKPTRRVALAVVAALALQVVGAGGNALGANAASVAAAQPTPGGNEPTFHAHSYFDDTTGPAKPGVVPGAKAGPLLNPKQDLGVRTPLGPLTEATIRGGGVLVPPAPSATAEVLGFAQSGEVSSGAWQSDLPMNLLSTIAYFGINVNADGSMVTNDSGYLTWRSAQTTNLINSAHAHGVRVVLTMKPFGIANVITDSQIIESISSNPTYRQNLINNIISELTTRGGDGVNIDFEGYIRGGVNPQDYATFIAQLDIALRTRIPQSSYLTVDTYGASAMGGTMMDITALRPYVDAFDVMSYDTNFGSTLPNAPLTGPYQFSDSNEMASYLQIVPSSQIILGIPYYGYKYSTTGTQFNAPRGGDFKVNAGTYADTISDFSCAQSLTTNWDAASQTPWASWNSPAPGDPCGGNHGSYRELYYDNRASLDAKYAYVNSQGLRGIGIWALGYDSGSPDLAAAITDSFSASRTAPPSIPPHPAVGGFGSPNSTWLPGGPSNPPGSISRYGCFYGGGKAGGSTSCKGQPMIQAANSESPVTPTPQAPQPQQVTLPPAAPPLAAVSRPANGAPTLSFEIGSALAWLLTAPPAIRAMGILGWVRNRD